MSSKRDVKLQGYLIRGDLIYQGVAITIGHSTPADNYFDLFPCQSCNFRHKWLPLKPKTSHTSSMLEDALGTPQPSMQSIGAIQGNPIKISNIPPN